MTITCLQGIVGGLQGHATCDIRLLSQIHLLCKANFMKAIILSQY